jgi:Arylsulfotransferase (ASST)
MLVKAAAGCLLSLAAMLSAALIVGCGLSRRATADTPMVTVFPIAGSRVASPQTQIAFRDLPFTQLQAGTIAVSGSKSGSHTGRLEADSDGMGGSFLPDHPFAAGETVTVRTSLRIVGAQGGTFRFDVAQPAGVVPFGSRPSVRRVQGDVLRFQSRPDLVPDAVRVLRQSRHTASGDIFVAPQYGPVQYGPMILSPAGKLIWFNPVPGNATVSDFRAQQYQGKPVLTWWQGNVHAGHGRGDGIIDDSSYQQLAVVHAANGPDADLHEFQLTPQGTALIAATYQVFWNTSSVHGPKRQNVTDGVVQEIDIRTGLVLFQWDSLDHVPLTDSYTHVPQRRAPFDYFHLNSISVDNDGNLVVSGRDTWAAYKVDRRTGRIIWTLGGKHSSFKFGRNASFAFQHDVLLPNGSERSITVFDNGGGLPNVHTQSRGIKLSLDPAHKTATLVQQLVHSPPLLAEFEGNVQQLPNSDYFVGWGQRPYFSEYDRHGKLIFDARFVANTANYRAFRLPWTGTPAAPPSVAALTSASNTTVYMSWNGATQVASWRILGGQSASALTPVSTVPASGFETSARIAATQYVQVAALDSNGNVLGTSPVEASK